MAQRPSTEPPPPARDADWSRLDGLLDRLLDLSDEEARAVLDRLPPEDAPLRPRLEAALAAARTDSGALSRPAAESWAPLLAAEAPEEPPSALAPGTRLGAWRIEGELGRGGMGTVYAVARADGAFEQRAALKLLKASADDPAARARFQRERQILARLEHPAIARLLDGGVAPDGRPWLVIERVDGAPINAFSDARRLTVEARLRLFAEVLAAVDFAHRNLIVHRDLKPSNILVSESGAVKLLDFGIAKLLDEEGEAERTSSGAPLTPQYAAPEQVTGAPVTTATDVYALGMVLYELLSGGRPYRVASGSALELERAIVDTVPPPPSTSARRAADAATARGSTAERLERRLAGDLDAIVLRAIAKDPARRYPSAAALAEDLARHLAGRPVLARPDALGYRVRSFVRRHRLGVAASAGLVLLLVAGSTALGYALVQAQGRLAEAERAEAIQRFLVGLFSAVDPELARGREVTLREVVDQGAARLATGLGEQPRTRAELLLTVGAVYRKLALYERAAPLLEEALAIAEREWGPSSPQVGRVLFELGDLHYWRDDYDRALAHQQRALAIFQAAGPGARAEQASALANVGATLRQLGRYDEAERAQRETLAIERASRGPDDLETARVATGLALTLHSAERDAEALPLAEEALRIRRARLVPDHPKIAESLETLGLVLARLGRYEECDRLLVESLAVRRKVYGADHPEVLEAMNSLASTRVAAGRWDDALELRREAVALARRIYPADNSTLAANVNNLATLCYRRRDYLCAEDGFQEALEAWRGGLGERHPDVASARNNLGMTRLALGRAREALPELEAALALRRELAGPRTPDVAQSLRNVGLARLALQDLVGARQALDRSLELSRQVYAERHPRLAEVLVARGQLALAEGRPRAAVEDFEEALGIRIEKLGEGNPLSAEVRAELARARSRK